MPAPGVKARIDRFWIALNKLERISKTGFDEFKSNSDLIDIAERNLQIVIEAIIDVSQHLISRLNWRIPKSYRDISSILNEKNVLSRDKYEFLDDSIIIRNIIIHNYIYLKPGILYKYVRNYGNYREIMNDILTYMERNNIDP